MCKESLYRLLESPCWRGRWFYEAVVLLIELFLVLSSFCSPVSFFAVLYITGKPSEAAGGLTWGLSFANSFRPSAVSGPFFHFQFCLVILSLERNENLITGGLITTFSVFEVCFKKPMQIYHWRHCIVNKYLSLCYIPVLYVLSSVIRKEVLLFEWQKILRACSEMSSLIASWPKWPICFYLLVSRDSGVNRITASESSVGAGILPQTKRWDFQLMF